MLATPASRGLSVALGITKSGWSQEGGRFIMGENERMQSQEEWTIFHQLHPNTRESQDKVKILGNIAITAARQSEVIARSG
jgi:hypothetical protein